MAKTIEHIKKIAIGASIYFVLYVAIHFKNYYQVGDLFGVIKGDGFDRAFELLSMPGFIPMFMMVILISYKAFHNTPQWFLEIFSLTFNCIFYGYFFYFIVNKLRKS